MDRKNKNPLLIGLLNVVLPGSCHVLIEKNWGKFIGSFIVGVILLGLMYIMGNGIQTARDYSLPQGLAPAVMLLFVMVPLFWIGLRTARENNSDLKASIRFKAQRDAWQAERGINLKKKREESQPEAQSGDKPAPG